MPHHDALPFEEWLLEQGVPPLAAINELSAVARNARAQADNLYKLGRAFHRRVYYELVQPIEQMTDEGVRILDNPIHAYSALLVRHLKECQEIDGLRPSTGITVDSSEGD